MREVVLYIAVSLDGYIADSKGSVDWISGQDVSAEMEDTFTPFFSGVDTVVMGSKTYHQVPGRDTGSIGERHPAVRFHQPEDKPEDGGNQGV